MTKADGQAPAAAGDSPAFDLVDLELFSMVAEAGSITGGAQRAHLALPSASARIARLERAVGIALLTRGRRGVTPTPAGELLLGHARHVLGQLERMRGELARHADGLIATIRLLANTAAVATFLPEQLVSFLHTHPDVDVDLDERPSHQIVQALAQGRADMGIVASSVDRGQLDQRPLREDRLVIATAIDHPLQRHRQVAFADCLSEAFVGLAEHSALYEHLEGHALPLGRRPHYRVRVPTIQAACQAVSAGVGISILPDDAAIAWRETYPIATIPLTDPWATRQLLLCTDAARPLSAPAAALAHHLTERARG